MYISNRKKKDEELRNATDERLTTYNTSTVQLAHPIRIRITDDDEDDDA